jgi:hypothetical protein
MSFGAINGGNLLDVNHALLDADNEFDANDNS